MKYLKAVIAAALASTAVALPYSSSGQAKLVARNNDVYSPVYSPGEEGTPVPGEPVPSDTSDPHTKKDSGSQADSNNASNNTTSNSSTSNSSTSNSSTSNNSTASSNSLSASDVITPQVLIVTFFEPERESWLKSSYFASNTHEVRIPGLSSKYPNLACTTSQAVCLVTTGESEINAASSMTALIYSPKVDLSKTYIVATGIGGVNPHRGTLGTAAWIRFSVQPGLQDELDAREMPADWNTGYWPLNTKKPGDMPKPSSMYGTELYETNTVLQGIAYQVTQNVTLNDTEEAQGVRNKFTGFPIAQASPKVTQCDVSTSDMYYSGKLLSDMVGNYTKLLTDGQGEYCMTAQEDSAIMEAILRATPEGYADYSRLAVMRTASDFDQPYEGADPYDFFMSQQYGSIAFDNLVVAGQPFVDFILNNWENFETGIQTQSTGEGSFYGNVFGDLRDPKTGKA